MVSRLEARGNQKAPRNWGKNITLISSIGKEGGVGASLVVEGSTNRTIFETYLEEVLLPTLKRGQVMVMDNLSAHKAQRVRELIEAKGCELIYLPPYSPEFNPIEICQPQCAFKHKPSYHWPPRAARAPGVGREARSRPPTQRRGGSAMSSRGAVPPRP
jgi:DDE superfamily endonuclease